MPIIYGLVTALALFAGWVEVQLHTERIAITEQSEADSVAANMVNYQRLINAYAYYKNSSGQTPNLQAFQAFIGDAADFIAQCQAAGNVPQVMTWYQGPTAGVTATLTTGQILITYQKTSPTQPSQAGVLARYAQLTHTSYATPQLLY